ncbi:uncharacterized protein DFL_000415 [Arthrobotrys flagrans]|uniref:Uncharacterized protein n=1 Tax=Arthrobotrys flagrans TaxID=97331 RepID=A0A437ADW0_ARTFL|nr:hypothetical protein DFL_000415 [Arthrobotrys flagrans]
MNHRGLGLQKAPYVLDLRYTAYKVFEGRIPDSDEIGLLEPTVLLSSGIICTLPPFDQAVSGALRSSVIVDVGCLLYLTTFSVPGLSFLLSSFSIILLPAFLIDKVIGPSTEIGCLASDRTGGRFGQILVDLLPAN